MTRPILFFFFTLVTTFSGLQAKGLSFHSYFSEGMVLQGGKIIRVKGKVTPDTKVTVSLGDQAIETLSQKSGIWEAEFQPLKNNWSPIDLKAKTPAEEVVIKNVRIGDVFLFARQTSIDLFPSEEDIKDLLSDISRERPPFIKTIQTIPSAEPLDDFAPESSRKWFSLDENNVRHVTKAALELAIRLSQKKEHPIAVVDLNMGYFFPISWMSHNDLLSTGEAMGKDNSVVESQAKNFPISLHEYQSGAYATKAQEGYEAYQKRTKWKGGPTPTKLAKPFNPLQDPRYPAAGYNSVIHPIEGTAFKAVLLQLGNDYPYIIYENLAREGNFQAREELGVAWKISYDFRKWSIYMKPESVPRIVGLWRSYFGDSQLPFGLIMPPASDLKTLAQHHLEVRELQRKTALNNDGVGLILPNVEHIPFSAQPKDQKVLSERCEAWIRGSVYQEADILPSGPVFERLEGNYSEATIHFKAGTAEGLKSTPSGLNTFEVANTDEEYFPAKAEIKGSTIFLKSEHVNRIVHVRYNWIEKPDLGLVNRAGLPAIPFRTDEHVMPRTIKNREAVLPQEYTTSADKWTGGDVTIINGSLSKGNWKDAEGWLGTTGILTAPFGPNMAVLHILPGSPADGKVFKDDIIFDVNGSYFGEQPLKEVSHALTHAESEAGGGKISFGLRRKGKILEVPLTLEVLGTYSSTSPYDCPKTDRIVSNMEAFLAKREGVPGIHAVYKSTEILFLMAAGTPKYQGLVRRYIYERMASVDMTQRIDPYAKNHRQNWHWAYDALMTGEYYLATGDQNVRPFLKYCLDYLAITQNKVEKDLTPWPSALAGSAGGWRHNFYGNPRYGMLTCLGAPALLGFRFAKEAGVEIDETAYQRGIDYFIHNGVKVANVIYGSYPEPYTKPKAIDMEELEKGNLGSSNGMKALVAILFRMEGDLKTAHINSFYSANSYNSLHYAHGGNFWANWSTALGAYEHSKESFIRFMKRYRWYHELHRMFNHSHYQGNARIGGGQYLPLVLPRQRLRILGSHESIFTKNPKEFFRPALKAHQERDYKKCHQLISDLIINENLGHLDLAKAKQLQRLCLEIQESIEFDLQKVERLIEEKKFYEASLDLPQLKGVVSPLEPRLQSIEKILLNPDNKEQLNADGKRYKPYMKSLRFTVEEPKLSEENEKNWIPLAPQSNYAFGMSEKNFPGKVSISDAARWDFKVVESPTQAPKNWQSPDFNAEDWMDIVLPISWHLYHTALLRTKINIQNKADIEALRVTLWTYRQQDMQVFINGKLVAKVNKASNNTTMKSILGPGALEALKTGENTIAVQTTNNWRWGRYMSGFESDFKNSVYNNGFTVLLDKKIK